MDTREDEIRKLNEKLAAIKGNDAISRARRAAIQRQIWKLMEA